MLSSERHRGIERHSVEMEVQDGQEGSRQNTSVTDQDWSGRGNRRMERRPLWLGYLEQAGASWRSKQGPHPATGSKRF